MTYCTHYQSPLGVLTIASDGNHITGLWMDGQKHFCSTMDSDFVVNADIPIIQTTAQWLDAYFLGKARSSEYIPLLPAGTPFQQQVWDALRGIPYGETATYGQIARLVAAALGQECMSAQAVGCAIGKNPISILIPCHRIIGAQGDLTGYAGGINRKVYLLRLEQSVYAGITSTKPVPNAFGSQKNNRR